MIFSEFPYARVDMDAISEQLERLTAQLVGAASFEEADRIFCKKDELECLGLRTMRTVAQIRRDIDTRDAFYDEEMAFYNKELPKLAPLRKAWTQPD